MLRRKLIQKVRRKIADAAENHKNIIIILTDIFNILIEFSSQQQT